MRPSRSLLALTQAAAALPGLASAEVSTDYLYSYYEEAELDAAKSARGLREQRYDIQTHLLRVVAPWDDQQIGATLTYETMSGASPWFVMPDSQGKPVQVMSGATIEEQRVDLAGTWSFSSPIGATALTAGYSSEDDYRSISAGVELSFEDESKTHTLSAGLGYSSDTIEPTDGGSTRFPERLREADKQAIDVYAGISRVLGADTVAQLSISMAHHDGYLSDPYKLSYIEPEAITVADQRPDGRYTYAVSALLRHALPGLGAALHADYRYYSDDWKIEAHTLELRWQQTLGDHWRLAPSLRWYSQSQAFFYSAYYTQARGDHFASSDYRLSPFGSLSARLDLTWTPGDWSFGGGLEYYEASADYALRPVRVESPGLVEYTSLQLRLARRF